MHAYISHICTHLHAQTWVKPISFRAFVCQQHSVTKTNHFLSPTHVDMAWPHGMDKGMATL